jgi:hypothetical protein
VTRVTINRHGLPRTIPTSVRRAVRQACGFGCVLCGRLPYKYDHFDPEYVDAKAHDPEGIALLCGNHEQDRTAGRINVETIRRARARPYRGHARWDLCLGTDPVTMVFGGSTCVTSDRFSAVRINGVDVISLERDEDEWLVNGAFCDLDGQASIRIHQNEVMVSRGHWDAALEGTALTVHSGKRNVVAELIVDAEARRIEVARLQMRLGGGHKLLGTADQFRIVGPMLNATIGASHLDGAAALVVVDAPPLGAWDDWSSTPEQHRASSPVRPERNDPCWCGSGLKYKKCHLAADEHR